MNRYVAVPKKLVTNEIIPEEATTLARIFSLEIRLDETVEKIQIIPEPRIKEIIHTETYVPGKIWSLNIHDEFTDMSSGCFLKVDDETFYPKIQEKHIVKFRVRFKGNSKKTFSVYVDDKEYFSKEIFER
jgi:hypothetical protein